MTGPRQPDPDRLTELLADRAVFGLTAEEQAELDALLAVHRVADPESLDRLAADLARSTLPESPEPPPAGLLARIQATAAGHLPVPAEPSAPAPRPRRNLRAWVGGLALAACVLVAAFGWLLFRTGHTPTPAERRAELLARSGRPGSDVVRLAWTATNDPSGRDASGDVVWSSTAQEGYMHFHGLPANDPTREQYQLWVFDAERDQRYPVDGGVFDIPPGTTDVVVPIRVKLSVARPVLFAVTVERPGGVVVSGRERLPLLAKAPEGGKG